MMLVLNVVTLKRRNEMKKVFALLVVGMLASSHAMAVIKCESDGRGGMCCWDVNKDGPFKPIRC